MYCTVPCVCCHQGGEGYEVDSDRDEDGRNEHRLSDDDGDEGRRRRDVEDDEDEYDSEEDEDYEDRPKKKKKRNAVSKFIVDEAGEHIQHILYVVITQAAYYLRRYVYFSYLCHIIYYRNFM